MTLDLTDEQFKSIVSGAILQSLDADKRDALIKGAIQHLLTPSPDRGGYGQRTTPLQDAFNRAVENVSSGIAKDMIEKDADLQTKIRALLNEALTSVFESKREETIQRVAAAFAKGLAYQER